MRTTPLGREGDRVPQTRTERWEAPFAGLVKGFAKVRPGQAEVLDNIFPVGDTAELRAGSDAYADLGAAVVKLYGYSGGSVEKLLGFTADSIWNVDRVSAGSNAYAEMEGMTSGDWSVTQISTTAGNFAVGVNGADWAFFHDGTDFNPLANVTVNNLPFDGLTEDFVVGETVSSAGGSATIIGITKSSATAGILKVGTITGTFSDDEAITGSGSGAAVVNGSTSQSHTTAITGVATSALSQVWLFKERLFLVEGSTMSVWYLPVKSIGGAASEIDLGAVFRKGGSVLFGATWSLDTGSGIDDLCLIVTDRGEVAVYIGTDPSSADTWALSGVYEIGQPLDKHAFFKAGGDLAILTEDGIVAISEVLTKDRAALKGSAITRPIEDDWRDVVTNRTDAYPVSATLWQSKAKLIVGTHISEEGTPIAYVANAQSGAWCRYTGWDVRCSAVSDDALYFGSSDGIVYQGETGGTDNGSAYTGKYVPKFSDFGRGTRKYADAVLVTVRAASSPVYTVRMFGDHGIDTITPPSGLSVPGDTTWNGGAKWNDGSKWGSGSDVLTYQGWKIAYGSGITIAPCVVVTSNQTLAPVFEIMSTIVRFEEGDAM